MKAPEPLYPCKFCSDEYSWPASDLAWSERYQDWVCGECWCDNCHDDDYEPDERGQRLSQFLLHQQEQELATLRAKAEAYDKGENLWMSFDVDTKEPYAVDRDVTVVTHDTWKLLGRHPQGNMPGGFIEKRVRVCEVTAAGENPALANK